MSTCAQITTMIRFWVPERLPTEGARAEVRQYLSNEKVAMLRSMGINTIREFAEADKYKILKLRGFDIPQVAMEDRLTFTDVCDALYLAKAIVDKCTVDPHRQYYDGEERMPWYNKIRWGGPAPMTYGSQEWHNRDYVSATVQLWERENNVHRRKQVLTTRSGCCCAWANQGAEVSAGDLEDIITGWDGCEYIRQVKHPNVPMIGRVEQVSSIRKPLPELQELKCKVGQESRMQHGKARTILTSLNACALPCSTGLGRAPSTERRSWSSGSTSSAVAGPRPSCTRTPGTATTGCQLLPSGYDGTVCVGHATIAAAAAATTAVAAAARTVGCYSRR